MYQEHRADLTYRFTDGQCSGVTLLIYDVSTSDIQNWAEEYTSLLGHSQIHQYSEDGRFIQRWKSGDWVVNLNQNIEQATARLNISYFKPGTMPAQLTQMLHEFPFPDFKANQQCDFRRLSWGMTQEQVEALEYLAPSATGINPSGTIYHIYGYTNCMGKRARLTHNFLLDQYIGGDYLISGSSIEEYKKVRADLENYYGAPALADEAENISYAGWSLPDKFLNLVFYPDHSQYGSLFTLTFVDPKHPEVQDGLFQKGRQLKNFDFTLGEKGFRGIDWGASLEEVLSVEETEPVSTAHEEATDIYAYNLGHIKVSGLYANLTYSFVNDKCFRVDLSFYNTSQSNYEDLTKAIQAQLGPGLETQKGRAQTWTNDTIQLGINYHPEPAEGQPGVTIYLFSNLYYTFAGSR